MGILGHLRERRFHSLANKTIKAHIKADKHLGNSSRAVKGPRNPKPPRPISSGKRMANHVQAPHKPDSNPYGVRQAQLNDARRAMASATPYNPVKKKKVPR